MHFKLRCFIIFLELLLFLCLAKFSIVSSDHNNRSKTLFNKKQNLRGRALYIQRPDYKPEYENTGGFLDNDNGEEHVQNASESFSQENTNEFDDSALDNNLGHDLDKDITTLIDTAGENTTANSSGSEHNAERANKKYQRNNTQRNISYRNMKSRRNRSRKRQRTYTFYNRSFYNRRRLRQNDRRYQRRPSKQLQVDLESKPTKDQDNKNMKQPFDDPEVKFYKNFHDKTISTCRNETNHLCRPELQNGTILNFMCIPYKQRCDGIKQCPLGDDEENCQLEVCKELQVRCREGKCATVCNGIPECDQLEDELFCGPVCTEGQLRCPDGNCAIVCDGKYDCKNKEDERNCKENLSSTDICEYGEVLCSDRTKCAKICDGIPQCEDGSDEKFVC